MASSVTLTIPGRPVPAARMTQRSKWRLGGREERHLAQKDAIAWTARAAGVEPVAGPVRLRCVFRVHGGRRGDLSNYIKLAEDALNGVAWRDDRQVVELTGRIEAVAERDQETEIEIEPLEVSA